MTYRISFSSPLTFRETNQSWRSKGRSVLSLVSKKKISFSSHRGRIEKAILLKLGRVDPAQDLQHRGFGSKVLGTALESDERWGDVCLIPVAIQLLSRVFLSPLADLPSLVQSSCEALFPANDFLPCTLVQKVVDRDHGFNCRNVGIGVSLAQQGIVHLLRRRVLPRALAVSPRNGRFLSFDRQRNRLIGRRLL